MTKVIFLIQYSRAYGTTIDSSADHTRISCGSKYELPSTLARLVPSATSFFSSGDDSFWRRRWHILGISMLKLVY